MAKGNNSRPVTIIYIGGYGRSGSTILDSLLGNQQNISSGGEIVNLLHEYSDTTFAGCSEEVVDIWKTAAEFGLKEIGEGIDSIPAIDHTLRSVGRGPGLLIPDKLSVYKRFWRAVYEKVAELTGSENIVDSSKTTMASTFRPLLVEKLGLRLKYILLVRDPRAVLWSRHRGVNYLIGSETGAEHNKYGLFRAISGWFIYTLVGFIYYILLRRHKAIIIYDDLLIHPVATLEALRNKLDINLDDVLEKIRSGEELTFGNGISGNRARKQGTFNLKIDNEWKSGFSTLPRLYRLFSSLNYCVYSLLRKL